MDRGSSGKRTLKVSRRSFLRLAASAVALPAVSRSAKAQAYPSRPVRIVVPYPAGVSPDIIARLVGQALSERLGQQVIIENRPGASGNIGTEVVVRAPADGYTLLLATGANAINAALYEKLNFDFIRDITPVATFGDVALVMVINPSFPAKTVPEFVAYAKANPGKIDMASAGSGTTVHLAAEMFKIMTGVDFALIQYRGNPWTDIISGHVQGIFGIIPASQEYIKTGKVRGLAVTGATRSEVLPDVPTMDEFVPGYEASTWYGVGAPRGTSTEVIEKLNKDINAIVTEPGMKARLVGLGLQPVPLTPTEFGKFIADASNKWAKVIRTANIKPD
jgi:tripartite-type tricarboxylate transporter receptor subunit TctC